MGGGGEEAGKKGKILLFDRRGLPPLEAIQNLSLVWIIMCIYQALLRGIFLLLLPVLIWQHPNLKDTPDPETYKQLYRKLVSDYMYSTFHKDFVLRGQSEEMVLLQQSVNKTIESRTLTFPTTGVDWLECTTILVGCQCSDECSLPYLMAVNLSRSQRASVRQLVL